MAFAHFSSSYGSTYMEPGPPASSRHEPLAATTGVPEARASAMGMPNPSNMDGSTNTVAVLYMTGRYSLGTSFNM